MALEFPTLREQVISFGDTKIGIIPELSLVSHFQVASWPVLYRPAVTGNVKRWGIPLMIPNFGRLKDGVFEEKGTTLPMHGFGRAMPWTVSQQDQTSISLQLRSSEVTRAVYPYDFTFTMSITAGEGSLTYVLLMENHGSETMPIAPGFHPYFTVAQQDKPELVVTGLSGFSPQNVEWDTQPPDNHYLFPHQVTIQVPNYGGLTIEELPVKGRYLLSEMQVWSEPISAPEHAFVCFEPILTHEDGLNRSTDRLNIAAHSLEQIIWRISAHAL